MVQGFLKREERSWLNDSGDHSEQKGKFLRSGKYLYKGKEIKVSARGKEQLIHLISLKVYPGIIIGRVVSCMKVS